MKADLKKLIKRTGPLAEDEVKNLLSYFGIQTTKFKVVNKESDLNNLDLKFPVALKVCSNKILHKTDVGGVKLNISDLDELRTEFKKFKKKFPKENLLIDQMAKKGVEMIIGLVKDPTFGLSIMVGVGGIYTELYQDVSFRVIPLLDKDSAIDMLDEVKGKKLLEGFRNIKADKKQVIDLIMKVSKIGEELMDKVDQMDLNPVFIYDKGYCVVDAKLILK